MRPLLLAAVIGLGATALPAQTPPMDHAAMPPAPAGAKRSMIKMSAPADGDMLQGSPTLFDVTFVHPMTLRSITLVDDTETDIPVTAAPKQTGEASAQIALPKLDPGTYKLHWIGVGGSGREMSGDLSFMAH
jgi:methionine-rich copper-binding protein CopC